MSKKESLPIFKPISGTGTGLLALIDEKERLEKLLNLEKQFQPLLDDNSFYYLPTCKKFVVREFMGIEIFRPAQYY